ncbi:MAG TPA: beta-propeller domain-containing protein [Mycobacteriales bacterium]|nr:beta-propeller domain-containing protein [Mycobacteriales bacterium]
MDDHRLTGVGQEASEQRTTGVQVSLFDVGTPASPRRIAQHHVALGHSAAELDSHAFLYWPKTGTLVIPLEVYDGMTQPTGGPWC